MSLDAADAAQVSFDYAQFLERVEGDVALLRELVSMMLDELPGHRTRLWEALDATDLTALRQQAHTLKGTLSNFAAEPARVAALEVETLAKAGQLAEIPAAIARLVAELDRLATALAAHVA